MAQIDYSNDVRPHGGPMKKARIAGMALGLLGLLAFGQGAHAQYCSGGGGTYQITMPDRVLVLPDAPVGTMLTPWVYGPDHGTLTTCTPPSTYAVASWTYSQNSTSTGITVAGPPGATNRSRVVPTNVPGIGLAVAARGFHQFHSWNPWNNRPSFEWPYIAGAGWNNDGIRPPQSTGGQVAVALVKTSQQVSAGNVVVSPALYRNILVRSTVVPALTTYYSISPVQIVTGTCDLAAGDLNRTIPLPELMMADFEGGAASRGAKTFDITATCSNASRVRFTFSGTPSTGLASLFANTGTARGVDLWLAQISGGNWHTINASSEASRTRTVNVSGNRAVLPVGAAYYKSGGAVTKGTFASAVTVDITYD